MNAKRIEIIKAEKKSAKTVWDYVLVLLFACLFSLEIALPAKDLYAAGTALFGALAISIGLKLISRRMKKVWLAGGILTAVLLAAGGIARKAFLNGGILYLNKLIESWNEKNHGIHSFFLADDGNPQIRLCLFMFLLVSFVVTWTVVLLHYKRNIAVLLFSFLLFAYLSLAADVLPVWAVIWMGINMLLLSALTDADPAAFLKKKQQIAVLLGGTLVLCAAILAGTRLIPDAHLTAAKKALVRKAEQQAYGESDLTDGDLTDVKDKKTSKEARLQVRTENEDAFYLRGFVGSDYTGSEWTELAGEYYDGENRLMQQWLLDTGNSPVYSLATPLLLSESYDKKSFSVESNSYEIKNDGAYSKYLYLPYAFGNITFPYPDRIDKDLNVKNFLTDQADVCEVSATAIPVEEYVELSNNGALTDPEIFQSNEEYFLAEQTYRDYVKEGYMEIPEDVRKIFDATFAEADISGAMHITAAVRQYLAASLSYSEKAPAPQAEGMDFAVNLLLKEKKGYSVHFATVGTLLFRYFGIPARYVEGYLRPAGEENITAEDAHAWVEIYRYGFGWVPIEVTPGYYNSETDQVTGMSIHEVTEVDGRQALLPEFSGLFPDDKSEEKPLAPWVIPVILFLLLFLMAAAVILRRKAVLFLRNRKIHGPDRMRNVRNMMQLIQKNARYSGLRLRDDFPLSQEGQMDAVFAAETENSYENLLEHANHVHYSAEGAGAEDVSVIERYLGASADVCYRRAGRLRRLKLKYLNVIC